MLPPVAQLLSVEMIRDGGSLAAAWTGGDGVEYWLFFPVTIETIDRDQGRISGWSAPVIIDRQFGISQALSWAHARIFISQFRGLAREARYVEILDVMEATAASGGEITETASNTLHLEGASWEVLQFPTHII